eukprot:362907-Chlamydomonas_euryale.AAC.16
MLGLQATCWRPGWRTSVCRQRLCSSRTQRMSAKGVARPRAQRYAHASVHARAKPRRQRACSAKPQNGSGTHSPMQNKHMRIDLCTSAKVHWSMHTNRRIGPGAGIGAGTCRTCKAMLHRCPSMRMPQSIVAAPHQAVPHQAVWCSLHMHAHAEHAMP